LDDLGFYRTPNGSFWDQDDEYFNRYGYDVNGGYYIKELEYIPGPNWLEDLGCYEKDKEKYLNLDLEKLDDEKFFEEENEEFEGDEIFKGDFEGEDDYYNDKEYNDILKKGEFDDILKGCKDIDINALNEFIKENEDLKENKKKKKNNKKNKNKKKISKEEDDDWKTSSD
jgi:hypothetical protein